ncbi:hypothetical protein FB446DRAFT_709994 [Lentinula raphanica]|nr:hypothetical protein FB446DRAFT_709994 [Lentinula raphanica]
MASSSKGSSSKRPLPKATTVSSTVPYPRKKLSVRPVDTLDFDAVHHVHFDRSVRELGKVANDSDALFLPASAEECSILVNRWKHLPNSASPAFSLRRYSHPDEVDFKALTEQDTNNQTPTTFYPPQLTSFCTTFATGSPSSSEAYQLYQALAFLQRGCSRLIRGHLAKAEIHRRLLAFTGTPNFSYSLQYYQLFWHGHRNCPLVAPLLIILICEFCEEHLTESEYAARVYDPRIRDGPGMSLKTRERLLEDITEFFELQDLAIPLPFGPSTREGQLILSVTSKGSRVDRILHPVSNQPQFPDPSFQISLPPTAPAVKARLRPLSPDFDAVPPRTSPIPAAARRKPPQKLPVSPARVDVDDEVEASTPEVFQGPGTPDVLVIRQSLARTAKTKPKIPEEFRKAPAPAAKREQSPAGAPPEPSVPEPPSKKRRTMKAGGKARASSFISTHDDSPVFVERERLRIQDGEPDYFHGDDEDVTAHSRFLTNPRFQPKTPFSQLISKTADANKRGYKIPFLRPPKWNVSDELKDFGAFANIGDTTFSLQGLSRFGYASSRFLWPSNNRTLPSPESLYSTNNCVTCISRGEVCEASDKHGGACRQCNGTHRSCPSCLSLEEHKDRFRALHNHIQGYPVGYAQSLDQYATALDHITKLQSTFAPLFQDAQQALLKGMQTVRNSGFDLNVVLSRWAEDNPNLPLNYDIVTWLATLFGWDSSCNLVDYLTTPEDRARLEAFMRENLPAPAAPVDPVASPTIPPVPPPDLPSTESPHRSRRRPAAAIPSNFVSEHEFHTPLPESTTVDDEVEDEAKNDEIDEVEEAVSQPSAGRGLLAEDEDESDEDDDPDVEVLNDDTSELPKSTKPPHAYSVSSKHLVDHFVLNEYAHSDPILKSL